ncbi:Uncharacterised protein [uncultured archaeon]|nr:Uncharacterised protein [uncultured archaeon]
MKNTKKFLKRKVVTGIFSIVSLIAGFWFLDSSVTGGVIVNQEFSVSPISFVSLLLFVCSAILIVYSLKKE